MNETWDKILNVKRSFDHQIAKQSLTEGFNLFKHLCHLSRINSTKYGKQNHIHTMGIIVKKSNDFQTPVHLLFVDFKHSLLIVFTVKQCGMSHSYIWHSNKALKHSSSVFTLTVHYVGCCRGPLGNSFEVEECVPLWILLVLYRLGFTKSKH